MRLPPRSLPAAVLAAAFAASLSASVPAFAKAELSGTWVLREIDGRAAISDAHTTLNLSEERITGSGGCNMYSGIGQVAEGRVRVGLLAMTKMGCAADILEQETRFASALPVSVRYDIDAGGAMRVYDARGRLTMRLTRAR